MLQRGKNCFLYAQCRRLEDDERVSASKLIIIQGSLSINGYRHFNLLCFRICYNCKKQPH